MALNMSDDEDVDFRRQHFQHPDDAEDIDLVSDSGSSGDEQVYKLAVSTLSMSVCDTEVTLFTFSSVARVASE